MAKEKLVLELVGNEYRLRQIDHSGNATEILLSEQSILTLAQSALHLRDHILAKRSRPGAEARILTNVVQVNLSSNLHNTMVHLGLVDSNKIQQWFAIPLEIAKDLPARLSARIATMEAAAQSQTKQ